MASVLICVSHGNRLLSIPRICTRQGEYTNQYSPGMLLPISFVLSKYHSGPIGMWDPRPVSMLRPNGFIPPQHRPIALLEENNTTVLTTNTAV